MPMPRAWEKSFFLYNSALPQTGQAGTDGSAGPARRVTWSQDGQAHSAGPGDSSRPGRSHSGQGKRTLTQGSFGVVAGIRARSVSEGRLLPRSRFGLRPFTTPSQRQAAVAQQLAGQLAQEAEDHHHI